jgi:thiol:disulfide interchange protein DsbD
MLAPLTLSAQQSPVDWSTNGPEKPGHPGESISVSVSANIRTGWHIYSITQLPGGPTRTLITVPEKQPFIVSGDVAGPVPKKNYDATLQLETETYEGIVEFKLPVAVKSDATPGEQALAVQVTFQACNETTCLPPRTVELSNPVTIAAGKTSPVGLANAPSNTPQKAVATKPSIVATPSGNKSSVESGNIPQTALLVQRKPEIAAFMISSRSFVSFLGFAGLMGALSLLTPCVFPMIPITVSYFTNHSAGSRRSAIVTALVYAIGIILTFSGLGMLLALLFGAGGVNQLAANPWVNLLISAIFLGLAFSLFGAYFIQIPTGMMNRMDAITRSKEGSQMVGSVLMGFTFTLTSFTCTAPFVGTLLVMTAQGNWRWPLGGMLAFSTVFALPFFFLALIPQAVARLPKSGGWMNSVKVVMGFLEIAAAMKFLSNADLVWGWGILNRQFVLSIWVGVGILTVVYVLGYFRMPHEAKIEFVGAARLGVAIVFLAITIWLVPGIFGRPLGELESFLPPELPGSSAHIGNASVAASTQQPESGWILNDYQQAVAEAGAKKRKIFIDFTGYTCTNCRWMEANMFPRPEVSHEMDKFVRVRLYTDGAGKLFQRQQSLQQTTFGTVALPLYAIQEPNGFVAATFPGLTRDPREFIAFLQKGSGD